MNVVRIIFAMYVLFLALNPCHDSTNYVDVGMANIATTVSTGQHGTSTSEDLCTPFCLCTCCSAHIEPNQAAAVSFAVTFHFRLAAPPYLEKPLIGNGNSVWQPPKYS